MANTIDITFLGTSSAQPSVTRSHSSLAVRINGTIWLFDAGEGIQRQLMYSTLKLGKINKVFITHLHGDHIYGLPGLVCTLTGALNPQNHYENNNNGEGGGEGEELLMAPKDPDATPILEIYGPQGLRKYLRSALMFTYSRLPIYYRVHELIMSEEDAKDVAERFSQSKEKEEFIALRDKFRSQIGSEILHPDELMGEDIHPDADGLFRDLLRVETRKNEEPLSPVVDSDNNSNNDDDDSINKSKNKNRNKSKSKSKKYKSNPIHDKIKVNAAYIKHTVPTLGYVLEEHDLRGNVIMELVEPPLLRNQKALEEKGIKQPLSLLRFLKNGQSVELPDGTVLNPDEVITPAEQRKIVILGDTFDPSKITELAKNPTILIHEATNMYEGDEEKEKSENEKEMEINNTITTETTTETTEEMTEPMTEAERYRLKVMARGHSTPEMAGAFASQLNASTLILNHFSSRYASLNHFALQPPNWDGDGGKLRLGIEMIQQSSNVAYPSPVNPPKRDLLSEKEKELIQQKVIVIQKNKKDNNIEIKEESEVNKKIKEKQIQNQAQLQVQTQNQNQNQNQNQHQDPDQDVVTLNLNQQKILKDWEIMEKIRYKAASTFDPDHPERIILADDYLQVECNRSKSTSQEKEKKKKQKKMVEISNSETANEIEMDENSNVTTNTNINNETTTTTAINNNDNINNSAKIPIYMAWNQYLI